MSSLKILAGATALSAALAFSGAAGAATLITIGTSVNNGVTITDKASGASSALFLGSVGGFSVDIASATFGPMPVLLNSTTNDVRTKTSGTSTLDVFVTIQGLTKTIIHHGFFSGFTENLLPTGWSVVETTYLDNSNIKYGRATTLGTETFTHATSPGVFTVADNLAPGSLFSVTERYHIVAKGAGSELSTQTISTGVPEPATWALLVMGFGGAGALLRRRRLNAGSATAA
jgi:hypothetical protein